MGLLTGKTAIVTGAARGIGKAIALKFASEGANVAFTDLVIDENGLNTEKEIAAFGVKAKGYASNAASFEDTEKVVNQIKEEFGSVDILVNNAGITKDGILNGISILSIAETPGLGMNAQSVLVPQFENVPATVFTYTKNGSTSESEIDAISGATITTKAIVSAVNGAVAVVKEDLMKGGN